MIDLLLKCLGPTMRHFLKSAAPCSGELVRVGSSKTKGRLGTTLINAISMPRSGRKAQVFIQKGFN
ncbi:MAG: hypothetical protein COA78_30195 [Blastopirellula sp.]|nr:MAG: hypothetical protein COA78_30195 [Blastopirellula sp.]